MSDDTEILLYNPSLHPGVETPTAVKRHLKEFGDISWYFANFLTSFGINFERVIEPGLLGWRLDNISSPRCDEEFALLIESDLPWLKFAAYGGALIEAAKNLTFEVDGHVRPKYRDIRSAEEQQLVVASGKFLLSIIHILKARFNTSYETVLDVNKAKLEKRIVDGTIFDKTGGDDR